MTLSNIFFKNQIRRALKGHSKALDIGIGLGEVWHGVPTVEIDGMDISATSLLICRQGRKFEKLIHMDVASDKDWPFADNSYGLVVSNAVLCFIRNAALVIERMISKTTPGGNILFNVIQAPKNKTVETVFSTEKGDVPLYYHSFDEIVEPARKLNMHFEIINAAYSVTGGNERSQIIHTYEINKPASSL